MQIALDRAPELLAAQTPQDYIKGLAVASRALKQARSVSGKHGGMGAKDEARTVLDELRSILEPVDVEA